MKPGETFHIMNGQLLEPLKGRLLDVVVAGEQVKARVVEIGLDFSKLVVVPEFTKD